MDETPKYCDGCKQTWPDFKSWHDHQCKPMDKPEDTQSRINPGLYAGADKTPQELATEHMRTQNIFESETVRVERAWLAGHAQGLADSVEGKIVTTAKEIGDQIEAARKEGERRWLEKALDAVKNGSDRDLDYALFRLKRLMEPKERGDG